METPQIHIYTESTPNPHSMKFVFNVELLPEGLSFDYSQPADGLTKEKSSPLAVALFGFEFVRRVLSRAILLRSPKGRRLCGKMNYLALSST